MRSELGEKFTFTLTPATVFRSDDMLLHSSVVTGDRLLVTYVPGDINVASEVEDHGPALN
jgi:hypothetical protein